jgi:hypothetical protein
MPALNLIKINSHFLKLRQARKCGLILGTPSKQRASVNLWLTRVVQWMEPTREVLVSTGRLTHWTTKSESRWPDPLSFTEFSDCSPWKRPTWRRVRGREGTVIIKGQWPTYFHDARRHVSLAPYVHSTELLPANYPQGNVELSRLISKACRVGQCQRPDVVLRRRWARKWEETMDILTHLKTAWYFLSQDMTTSLKILSMLLFKNPSKVWQISKLYLKELTDLSKSP